VDRVTDSISHPRNKMAENTMKKNSFVGWLASHVMLALVVLAQVVFPAHSLMANCVEGYNGPYSYLYDPVSQGHGDWTSSNLSLNSGTSTIGSNGTYFWGFTGSVPDVGWPAKAKQHIFITFSNTNIVTGKFEVFKTTGGNFELASTHYFTNYSGSFGTEMYRFYDCYNGYKIKMTINGCDFKPEIERWANNN
jgi:hypothetical protein